MWAVFSFTKTSSGWVMKPRQREGRDMPDADGVIFRLGDVGACAVVVEVGRKPGTEKTLVLSEPESLSHGLPD